MPINCTYIQEKGYLYCTVVGEFSNAEFEHNILDILNSSEYPPDIRTLWDARQIDLSKINLDFEKVLI